MNGNIDADALTIRQHPELQMYRDHFNRGDLYAFSDSSFADQTYNGRSTYGYDIFFNGGVLAHRSREFGSVLGSTVAAEYVALSETGRFVRALQQLLPSNREPD